MKNQSVARVSLYTENATLAGGAPSKSQTVRDRETGLDTFISLANQSSLSTNTTIQKAVEGLEPSRFGVSSPVSHHATAWSALYYKLLFVPLVLCILACSSTAHASTLSAPPNSLGLYSYWTMDGKNTNWTTGQETDSSGNGNNGQFANTSASSAVTGKIGQAAQFNGTNQYIYGSWATLALGTGDFTVSLWVDPSSFASEAGLFDTALLNGDGRRDNAMVLVQNASTGSLRIFSQGSYGASTNGALKLNSMNHVVITRTGTTIHFYINGSLDSTTETLNTNLTFGGEVIGRYADSPAGYFTGSIDDVRVYGRALSTLEVQTLYGVGTATQAVSQTRLIPSGLVGYWTMDGKNTNWTTGQETDSSGNGNTGQFINMSTTTSPVLGKIGQAISFNGSTQYSTFAGINGFGSFVAGGKFTVSLWAKTNIAATRQVIMGDWDSGGNNESFSVEFGGYGQPSTHITTNFRTGYANFLDSNYTYSVGKWNYITVTYDGAHRSIYINGVLANSDTISGQSGGVKLALGRAGAYDGLYLNGSVDDVRIYNRALSVGEIQKLYAAGAGSKVGVTQPNRLAQGGLVGYWSFNGKDMDWATGQAFDTSGNGNNGQLINVSTTTSPVAGKIGQALSFTGSQWVQVANSSSLNITGSQISFGAWVYPTTLSGYQGILGLIQLGNVRQYAMYLTDGNPYAVYVALSGVSPAGAAGGIFNISSPWKLNVWNHLFFTYNSLSGTAIIYLNGVPVYSSNSWTGTIASIGNYPIYIGDNTTTDGFPFHGTIDDVRIYNRALSAAEVKALYNQGK